MVKTMLTTNHGGKNFPTKETKCLENYGSQYFFASEAQLPLSKPIKSGGSIWVLKLQ